MPDPRNVPLFSLTSVNILVRLIHLIVHIFVGRIF